MRAILTYHGISDRASPITVSPEVFAQHVHFLASGTVTVTPLADLLRRTDEEGPALAITFDDAFAHFEERAWPLLRDHGLPVTLYAVSGRAGGDNRWDGRHTPAIPTFPLCDWETLGRLAEEGVEIGAHSRSHPDLRQLPDEELREEIEGCAEEIASRLGKRPAHFAYPFGFSDGRVEAAAAAAYRTAVTTELSLLRPGDGPHALPRLDAFYLRRRGRLERFGSDPFARFVRGRAWLRGLRGHARRLLGRRAGG